jgi:hypothetical protein
MNFRLKYAACLMLTIFALSSCEKEEPEDSSTLLLMALIAGADRSPLLRIVNSSGAGPIAYTSHADATCTDAVTTYDPIGNGGSSGHLLMQGNTTWTIRDDTNGICYGTFSPISTTLRIKITCTHVNASPDFFSCSQD